MFEAAAILFVLHTNGGGVTTAEFQSQPACEQAVVILEEELKGKTSSYLFKCALKGSKYSDK